MSCSTGVVEWGFTSSSVSDLLVRGKPLVRESSPFADKTARRGVVWLEPGLEAEVSYSEVMQGRLRAPVFRRVLGRFSPFLGDPTRDGKPGR